MSLVIFVDHLKYHRQRDVDTNRFAVDLLMNEELPDYKVILAIVGCPYEHSVFHEHINPFGDCGYSYIFVWKDVRFHQDGVRQQGTVIVCKVPCTDEQKTGIHWKFSQFLIFPELRLDCPDSCHCPIFCKSHDRYSPSLVPMPGWHRLRSYDRPD